MVRSPEALELIRVNPLAYVLTVVIAHRARWRPGFSAQGLGTGEAFLGDYGSYGMSEQQYRTAKAQLEKWKFATFKATNKGTIAKLSDARLFVTTSEPANGPANGRLTDRSRTANGQVTTKEEGEKERRKEKAASPSLESSQMNNTPRSTEQW